MSIDPWVAESAFSQLVIIMQKLRDPENGCPWDIEQDFASIAPYTIEEAYEVLDAIQRNDMSDLRDELGDLLLQVVFHAQMASEAEYFSITDVAEAISEKMIRRHPHVFGADATVQTAHDQRLAWEETKAVERQSKAATNGSQSALEGVASALPSLLRAEKLQKRAARTGFDWSDIDDIFAKLDEELCEVKDAINTADQDHIEEEVGDLLFVCANIARRLNIDPETALRKANAKFESRFRAMEVLAQSEDAVFSDLSLDDQETLWQRVKKA